MLTKNGQRTMMIRCILIELLQCKVLENADVSTIFELRDAMTIRTHQITMIL